MIVAIQIDAPVDRRMHDKTARIRFVGVVANLEIGAESIGNLGEVVLRRCYSGKSARTFNAALSSGEIRLGHYCARIAVLRRTPRMERLRHIAEHLPETRRLCRGKA